MDSMLPDYLPHLGAALVIASIALTVARRFVERSNVSAAVMVITLAICLLPMTPLSVSHYARVLTGDLSITSLMWLSVVAWLTLAAGSEKLQRPNTHVILAVAVVLAALCLYPTALGFGPFDLYATGYSPMVLTAVTFTLFAWAIWHEKWLPAGILLLAFAAWYFRALESDNLWDYLLDPVISTYAIAVLIKERHRIRHALPGEKQLESLGGLALIVTLAWALI